MSRPLLLANTMVYKGPWTPARGLEGVIRAEGLVKGEDEVVIVVRDPDESESDTMVTMQYDAKIEIGPIKKALIRALRTKSSGAEVHVWVS
jgi:hypothetical protein